MIASNPDALVGTQIDQYRLLKHIARGGMADVYLATDVTLNRQAAFKIMLPALAADGQFVSRFQREAQTVAQLEHPNIVQIFGVGLAPGSRPYLAMQFIEGGALRDSIEALASRGSQLEAKQALGIIGKMADALELAHQAGVIHRDIKPSNILIRPDGSPVLVDLGIASVQGEEKLTMTGALIGTPHYMSPEQASGKRLDGRSDIYSLGVILYELLAGRKPFEAGDPLAVLHQHVYEPAPPLEQLNRTLSRSTAALVGLCLEKDPDRRFQSAAALRLAINEAIRAEGGQGIVSPSGVWRPHPSSQFRLSQSKVKGQRQPEPPEATRPSASQPESPVKKAAKWAAVPLVLLLVAAGAYFLTASFAGEPEPTVTPARLVRSEEAPPTPLPATATTAPTSTTAAAEELAPVSSDTPVPPTATPEPSETPLPADTATPEPTPVPPRLPPSGHIIYTCFVEGFDQICRVGADGSSDQQLTFTQATDFYGSASPDGGQIVFSSRREGTFDIYQMDSGGGGQSRINREMRDLYAPNISPDGSRIVFTAAQGSRQNIWVMNRDGSEPVQLTFDGQSLDPVWSPDGRQIAYSSEVDEERGHYIMAADGSGARKLETGLSEIGGRSSWSPDGQRLAFYAGPKEERQIYLIHVETLELVQLTSESSNLAPAFSPDGQWIVFTSYRDGDAELFLIRPDGSDLTQISFNSRPDWQPRWSP